ncbi:helix-turn-helix domain-containing protein [Spirosoma lacussanchae]|uniref:helix-turn-helix domain-containing protein n=1 Tax=Spirosoma lacussanchae TaxID=1884249 RepID=UPI001BB15491|nr:hypothetical protein [Spirosoma lacussanchae]
MALKTALATAPVKPIKAISPIPFPPHRVDNRVRLVDHDRFYEITTDYRHVYDFFELLEKETNLDNPIRMRTARHYAETLNLNPNYLNGLVKKHTGQTISTLIKNRLLEESKALLVQTGWTLQEISQISASFSKNT